MQQGQNTLFAKGNDTLPRHRVEVVVRGDRDGVEGPERPEGAAVLLHLDEGDGVAQHLQPSLISLIKITTQFRSI